MSPDPGRPFTVEPWHVREPKLDMAAIGQVESVFALSNGHIGLRGNLDEGEPHATPGTYLNSFYEKRPLPYAEGGYGYPESGQTIINVTNGKLIRLLVEDEPFDLRYGELRHHERVLDMQAGTLTREVEWASPAGRAVRVRSVRMVSLTQRAIAAIRYEVEVLDGPALLVVQSELVANEQLPARAEADPRVEAALTDPLLSEQHGTHDNGAWLIHQTRQSGLRVAAAMDHEVEGPAKLKVTSEATEDIGRTTVITRLQPGETLTIIKYLAYGWSARRSQPALHDQVRAALAAARFTGWDGLLAEQRGYLDAFWSTADIEIDGDAELQQAVRLAIFHVLQAGARAERRAIGAKGLTGDGYDGHTFWDTETFSLPVLSFLAPEAAADALRWRQSILPLAYERAEQLGLAGAAFPWRTIRGQECSGYWPAGTAAFHINADIADAARRHVAATGDTVFEREVGLELLVATARLWRSLGHHDSSGSFRIDGITGPDEYTAIVDNNVYTNLMAQLNLRVAADTAAKHRRAALALGVNAEEMASWRDAAKAMTIPFDEVLGVHPQSEGFTQHQHWDFENTPPEHYPLLLHVPYFDLYRVRPRPDGAQLRLLRGDHGAGLVALGLHPGRDRGVDGPPRPGLRLPRRSRPRRRQRPGGQLRPRHAHRVDGGHLDRGRHGVRRHAVRRRGAALRPAAAACALADLVRAQLARPAAARRNPPGGGGVPARGRRADAVVAPRRAGRARRRACGAPDPAC
jgi:alpha,alpha-trehalose phosphorylase